MITAVRYHLSLSITNIFHYSCRPFVSTLFRNIIYVLTYTSAHISFYLYLYFRVLPSVEQFTSGMPALWKIILEHSLDVKELLVSTNSPMTIRSFKSLYKVSWSESGSNNRSLEEETMFGFEAFL